MLVAALFLGLGGMMIGTRADAQLYSGTCKETSEGLCACLAGGPENCNYNSDCTWGSEPCGPIIE